MLHSGLSDTDVISYNKDGQITEEVKEYRINGLLKTKVETKYAVLDSNTGEAYKSSTITTAYSKKDAVKIDKEYFDKQGNKNKIISETKDSHGQKCIKISSYSYNDNKISSMCMNKILLMVC